MKRILTTAQLLIVIALPLAAAETKPIEKKGTVTVTSTIEAIDHSARTVTLKDKDGNLQTLYAEPEIKRFDELKVGDKVTFKYSEAVAVAVIKADAPAAANSGGATVTRGTGPKPSGTVTREVTATVTVKAVDHQAKSMTFTGANGRTVSVRVEDPSLLKDVKPGDRIQVTYSNALIVSVE